MSVISLVRAEIRRYNDMQILDLEHIIAVEKERRLKAQENSARLKTGG